LIGSHSPRCTRAARARLLDVVGIGALATSMTAPDHCRSECDADAGVSRVHGGGLGAELLVFALETMVDAARRAGGRIVVVDAIDDNATRCYEHHDFRPPRETIAASW